MVRIHLSRLLGDKKWSQAQLARVTGIRYNTVNDLYHEMAESIKIEHIEKICETLGCTASDLIEYIPPKKKKDKPGK